MGNWQQLMKKGNKFYAQKNWSAALIYYYQAISSLENSIAVEFIDIQQVIQGWICGYHNIAITYEQQGLIKRSRDTLIKPFRIMLALTHHPDTSVEMRLTANYALNMTLSPLLEFANNHPNEYKFINSIVEQLHTEKSQDHLLH